MKATRFNFFFCFFALLGAISSCKQEEKVIVVTAVSINQPSAEMIIGETLQLSASVLPANAIDKEVTWATSKKSVASVDQNGLVTALSEGVSTISAMAGGKTGTCTITVSKGYIAVESISLDYSELPLVEGDEFVLKATIKPDDATNNTISWSSSDNSIAIVDGSGKVKAIKAGEATIKASAEDKTAECRVTVSVKKIDVSMIVLSKSSLSMIVGEEQTITATISPDNATVQTVQWSSSNPYAATIENGLVRAIKEGNTKIVAYADGKTAECDVTVNYIPVQNISIVPSTLSLYEGEEYELTAKIVPENATYQEVKWTTSNSGVATVENGRIIAVKKGTTVIMAEANGKSSACQVEVLSSMAEISLNKSELRMIVGETTSLSVVVTPADATLKEKVVWSSSDETIATIDESGIITAIKEGNATISATVEGKKAECLVTIDYVHVSSIDISQSEATMYIGENIHLTATLMPTNVTYKTIEWTSSNEDVVMVSNNGEVTAVGKGAAIVTARSDGKETHCSCTVLVPLSSLSFDKNSLSLFNGSSATLVIVKNPSDATIKGDISWASSNSAIATVSDSGVVTAINKGSATITAAVDGCTASCHVTVNASVTGISLNKTSATLNKGESIQLTYTILPSGATLQGTVSWSSSAPTIVSVDNQGKVKALGAGTADISVSLEGFTAICTISVVVPVNSISLNKTNLELDKGNSETLIPTFNPSDATDKSVSWKSSNTSVATVDSNGTVTAVAGGTAVVTATASGKTASCNVAVSVPVSSVTLNRTSYTLTKNSSISLTATVYPNDASDKTVTWESSNPLVAVVDHTGKVTAVGGGIAVITATSGGKTASCTITVKVPVTSVTLNKSSLTLLKGETETLVATVYPTDATNKKLNWKSSSNSIATVDENGIITTLAGGNTTISVTTEDGSYSASCSLHVVSPPTNFAFKFTKIAIGAGMSVGLTIPKADSYYQPYVYTSDNPSIAYYSDSSSKLVGVSAGTTTITVSTSNGEFSASIEVAVGPYADMGTSVKWSVCNLKSTTIEGYGGYYAWAETGDKSNTYSTSGGANPFNWYGYKYGEYPGTWIHKYVYFYQNRVPYQDYLRVLEPEDDAATVALGSPWRIPSNAEWAELKANCTFTAHKVNSVSGVVVTSNITGLSVFFPYAGYYSYDGNTSETQLYKAGSMCYYWTNELSSSVNSAAKAFYYPNIGYYDEAERCIGLSVRAVYDE